MNREWWAGLGAAALLALVVDGAWARGDLNILTWSDYSVSPAKVLEFTRAEGLNVKYGILDSDDSMQAKLLSGHSGYDVVYPSSNYLPKQIEAGVYEKLDWSKIPNRANLDPVLLGKIATQDPGNRYGVPYVWGTEGVIVNVKAAREALGPGVPLDSWDLLFKPEVVSRLHECGVSLVDSASDVFPVMLAYMGRNPNSRDPADYQAALDALRRIRPYIDQFNSAYLNDVAGGDMCVAMGWSGDAAVIRRRAREADLHLEIRYIAPRGKTGLWFTLMGIPKDAANKENAYKWINHMIDVNIAAEISNSTGYPTAVSAARPMIRAELASDPSLYPSEEATREFFVFAPIDPALTRMITRMWLDFKAGR
jgi:spermidine/putrescine-binding protein